MLSQSCKVPSAFMIVRAQVVGPREDWELEQTSVGLITREEAPKGRMAVALGMDRSPGRR